MRGASLKEFEKRLLFRFRHARSLPPGPTITDRLTGLSRNLHGAKTECQGAGLRFAIQISNKFLAAIAH